MIGGGLEKFNFLTVNDTGKPIFMSQTERNSLPICENFVKKICGWFGVTKVAETAAAGAT